MIESGGEGEAAEAQDLAAFETASFDNDRPADQPSADRQASAPATQRPFSRIAVLLGIGLLATLFFALDFDRYLTLDTFRQQRAELAASFAAKPFLVAAAFMAINITALALCLPGAVLTLSLAGGAIFGFAWGTPIVLLSVVIGDSVAFLVARHLARGWVEKRFGAYVATVDRGVERNGAFYLLSLRLLAVVPFFVVNLTMGLTRMPLRVFAPVSFIGLIPATCVYVFTGTRLSQIDSASDIYSPQMIGVFLLLALVPLVAALARNRLAPTAGEVGIRR